MPVIAGEDLWWDELLARPLNWKVRMVFADWLEEHGEEGESMRRRAEEIRAWLREQTLDQWKVTACGFLAYVRPLHSTWYNQVYLLSPEQEESLTL